MASGATLLEIFPQSNEPPASTYAQLNTRNGHSVLDFDAALDEAAVFKTILPRNYGSGGLTVYVHWVAATATSGVVVWSAEIERDGEGIQDIDADGFATAQTAQATAPATSGNIDIQAITFTDGAQIDSLAVGEGFRLRIKRLGSSDANDTMAGDAELWGIEIKET